MNVLLFIRPHLGDAVFTIPALRAVAADARFSSVTCASTPRILPVLKMSNVPIHYVATTPFFGPSSWLRLYAELCRLRPVEVVSFSSASSPLLLSHVAKAERTACFRGVPFDHFATDLVRRKGPANAEAFLRLVEGIGVKVTKRSYRSLLSPPADAAERADCFLAQNGICNTHRFVLLLPGAKKPYKRWPLGMYADTAVLMKRRLGFEVVLSGSRTESGLLQRLGSLVSFNVTRNVGNLSLEELTHVMRRASVVIGNDSGATHLAAAVGASVVAIFGPTDPRYTGLARSAGTVSLRNWWGVICHHERCEFRECLRRVSVDAVFEAAVAVARHRLSQTETSEQSRSEG